MSILTRIVARLAKLPPAQTYDLVTERDLKVPMPDGVTLLADHYAPQGQSNLPTILIRSPYGREIGSLLGPIFAERGFQVVVQSNRGTFGSGGKFDPFGDEKDDGLATITWLKQQSWYAGKLAMFGPSYLGYVQWSLAEAAADELGALAIQVSTSEFREHSYPGETFALQTMLQWSHLMSYQEKPFAALRRMVAERKLKPIYQHLPLNEVDKLATGDSVHFFQDWLVNAKPDSKYWRERDFSYTLNDVKTPIYFTTGWYDIFLPWTIRDYCALRAAGQQPFLTIGAWQHTSLGLMGTALREGIPFFRAYLLGDKSQLRQKPVRIYVTGAKEWREYDDFPVPNTQQRRWYLQPKGQLAQFVPPDSPPDTYRYDPANPTPSLSGPALMDDSSPKDNSKLEARSDVLTYTTETLAKDVEVIGIVRVELCVKSSLQHTDFFARLCDVDERGRSMNVCDMIYRVAPNHPATEADGTRRIVLDLWATAHRFKAGHQIRLQVSSGAHPRFARNTGSGEPLATATQLIAADQSIYHDPQHPSSVFLPVVG
jgi:putative CocE/NonD family hydrolase